MKVSLLLQGRLGNNLFQLSFLKYSLEKFIQKRQVKIFCTKEQIENLKQVLKEDSKLAKLIQNSEINIWETYKPNFKMRIQRLIAKNIPKTNSFLISNVLNDELVSSKEFNYKGFLKKKRILIDGYFQYGDFIKSIDWDKEFKKINLELNNRICMHIRRSDTFSNGHLLKFHCSKSYGYYDDCLNIFSNKLNIEKNKLPIDIYTDNKLWCEKVFNGFSNLNITSKDMISDFLNMQNYRYYIISNSTFAYFPCLASNNSKSNLITIIPTLWSNCKTIYEVGLIQDDWIDI
tara:strand:- start:691 stop:1557 length:867 start_codon:yes stop_codon:yes gene_type:complete